MLYEFAKTGNSGRFLFYPLLQLFFFASAARTKQQTEPKLLIIQIQINLMTTTNSLLPFTEDYNSFSFSAKVFHSQGQTSKAKPILRHVYKYMQFYGIPQTAF